MGRALLDEGLALAAARGWLAVELEIERGHERAANLHERAGFRPLTRSRWSRRVVAFAMPPQPV